MLGRACDKLSYSSSLAIMTSRNVSLDKRVGIVNGGLSLGRVDKMLQLEPCCGIEEAEVR